MVLTINEHEYKLKYGYKTLAKSNILKEVTAMQTKIGKEKDNAETMIEVMGDVLTLNAKMLLAALQKYNKEFKVDYDSPKSVDGGLDKVYDLMDDYLEEEEADVMGLFNTLVTELFENGFLSKASRKAKELAAQTDATIIPMDHLMKD